MWIVDPEKQKYLFKFYLIISTGNDDATTENCFAYPMRCCYVVPCDFPAQTQKKMLPKRRRHHNSGTASSGNSSRVPLCRKDATHLPASDNEHDVAKRRNNCQGRAAIENLLLVWVISQILNMLQQWQKDK